MAHPVNLNNHKPIALQLAYDCFFVCFFDVYVRWAGMLYGGKLKQKLSTGQDTSSFQLSETPRAICFFFSAIKKLLLKNHKRT